MGLYEELNDKKISGVKLNFDCITKEELQRLFFDENITDRMIGELYDIAPSKVKYRRSKYGINLRDLVFNDSLENIPEELRQKSKSNLLVNEKLTKISKAITHFAFRNGPIEDMHANNQLTERDMETLNRFMVNRLAYVFKLIIEEKWCELEFLINETDKWYGHEWDDAIVDDGCNRKLLKMYLDDLKKNHRL